MSIALFLNALPKRWLAALFLLASLQSYALTLGRVQGAALIGRPLEVTVQVQLDPNQSLSSACFEADVFYADTRQDPAGVTVLLEPTAAPLSANLRIASRSRIDEPIVTVYVRAGCAQMVSRRYVLLADIVSEQAAPLAPRVASVPLVEPASSSNARVAGGGAESLGSVAAPFASAGVADQAEPRSARPPRTRAADAPQRARPAQTQPSARTRPQPSARTRLQPAATAAARTMAPAGGLGVAQAAPPADRSAGQSRLKLDPLDMLSERVATLESNSTTVAPAQVSEREAREAQRLDRLEASVKALLVLAEKNEASLLDMRSRLEKAQTDRFGNNAIYVLFSLLLLCLLAFAYLLTRMSRRPEDSGGRWFDARQPSNPVSVPPQPQAGSVPAGLTTVGVPSSPPAPGPLSQPAPIPQTDRLPMVPTQPMPRDSGMRDVGTSLAQVDVSLVEMSASTFDRLMQSGTAPTTIRAPRDTVPTAVAQVSQATAPTPSVSRPRIRAEELIDIRQRAEFFVTLGQTDQAVQVLEARIARDGASCPQVYLDLLKLFHSLGLKADFRQVSDDFTRLFNTRLPEFAEFGNEGRSLEAYPGSIDRLIAAWHRPTVVGAIEQMIYRSPMEDAGSDAFDLAAFRELLTLHAVAQLVEGAADGRTSASLPLYPAADGTSAVDIDLTELFSPKGTPTPIMPQRDRPASIQETVPFDPTVAPGTPIDFDLSDVDLDKKPGKGV